MLEPIEKNPRKITLGFPRCVSGKPFKLVHSAAEYRAWLSENPQSEPVKEVEAYKEPEKEKAKPKL